MKNWTTSAMKEGYLWEETPELKQWQIENTSLIIAQRIAEEDNELFVTGYLGKPDFWFRQFIEGELINDVGYQLFKVALGAKVEINGEIYQEDMLNDHFKKLQIDFLNIYCSLVCFYVDGKQYCIKDNRIRLLREKWFSTAADNPVKTAFMAYYQTLLAPIYETVKRIPFPDQSILFIGNYEYGTYEAAEAIMEHPAYLSHRHQIAEMTLENIKAVFSVITNRWLYVPEMSKPKMAVFRKKLNDQFDWVIPVFKISMLEVSYRIQALIVPAGLTVPLHAKHVYYATERYPFSPWFSWHTELVRLTLLLDYFDQQITPFVETHLLDVIIEGYENKMKK